MRDRQEGIDHSKVHDLSNKAKEIIFAYRGPGSEARNGVFAGSSFHVCYSESEETVGAMKHVRIAYKQDRVFEWEEKKTYFYTPGAWEEEFTALYTQLIEGSGRSRIDIRPGDLPHPATLAAKTRS